MKYSFLIIPFLFCSVYAGAQNLSTVESVEYDEVSGRFLASNGNSIIEVDGNGNEVAYFGNAAADYGMEVMNGVLFAIESNRVKGFNLGDGSPLMDLQIPGVSFLNGMASDGSNRLWVSDFSAKKIYEVDVSDINNPSYEEIVSNTVSTPNGIVFDELGNRLVFVNWGSSAPIKQIDLSNYAVTTIVSTMLGNCDGIDHDGNGNFYVSSWTPTRITRFTDNFSSSSIITAPGISSPADICYATAIDTLAIPNSGNSTITFVGFETSTAIVEPNEHSFGFNLYPNPITDSSILTFEIAQSSEGKIEFFDLQGKLVSTFYNGTFLTGENRILMVGNQLPSGQYMCVVTIAGEASSQLFLKL